MLLTDKDMHVRELFEQHASMFAPAPDQHGPWCIPRGWLPHIQWCLNELHMQGAHVRVSALWMQDAELLVRFYPGDEAQAEHDARKLLTEASHYCPWCGRIGE